LGCGLDVLGYAIIGPLPFLPLETSLPLVVGALVLVGVGTSAKLVAAPVDALKEATGRRGLSDDMSTYGLVSAMYTASNSIAAFVGPSVGGFLLDNVGYRTGSYMIFGMDAILLVLVLLYMLLRRLGLVSRPQAPHYDSNVADEERPILHDRRGIKRYSQVDFDVQQHDVAHPVKYRQASKGLARKRSQSMSSHARILSDSLRAGHYGNLSYQK